VIALSRRGFLQGTVAAGGALSLAVTFGGCGGAGGARVAHADKTGELYANLYVTVLPDGRIALAVNKAEIGQGITTAYTTLAAEELYVPIDRVEAYYADSHSEYRTSFYMHVTGGSTSTKEAFPAVRKAAAAAREMLVAAAAASWGVRASECTVENGVVRHAASGKEAGYGDLTLLASRQAVPGKPRLKSAKEFTLIGKVSRRVDARRKVDGTAVFGTDVVVPDMVHATVVHAPVYGAKAERIDDAAARRVPGVIDVFGIDGGVAIVAAKYWQARAAALAVDVTWGKGDTEGLDTEVLAAAMRASTDRGVTQTDRGNAGGALKKAATRLEALYEAPYLAHATMEPQNCTVHVKGGVVEVWAPTQGPTIVQATVAHALGLGRDDVMVHTLLSGGGFGRRFVADVCGEAAVIAKRVGKPVKLIWSRESDMTQGFYRPVYAIKMEGGLDAAGAPTAVRVQCTSQSITASSGDAIEAALPGVPGPIKNMIVDSMLAMFATSSLPDMFAAEGLVNTPYQWKNYEIGATPVRTKLPVSSWRSVGNSVTGFAAESFVDEMAHAAKEDPLAFRRALVKPGSRQARVLDALEKLAGWGTAPARAGVGRGLARHFSFDTEVGEVADVEIVDGRIRVRKVYCVVECGLAVNPDLVKAQMEGAIIFGLSAALDQKITIVDGVVQQRNFDTFPALRMHEAPEIVVEVLESADDPTGVGEPGLPPIAACVANGVFAATGVRLRSMPLQPAFDLAKGGAT
jgi:isoquinoline 1-oxidoreductase beta subunit